MSKFGGPMEDDREDQRKPISPNHDHPPWELAQAPGGEEGSFRDPGSKGSSMKIKIKMPPPHPHPHPHPPPRPVPEPANLEGTSSGRYCCGKFFPSGKAWGGHKRHHSIKELKSNDNNSPNKPKLQPPPKNTFNVSLNEVEDDEVPVCCLCGKKFPSMNSLFGHMRFHRDRGWRGIKPPTKHASVSSSPNPSSPLYVRTKNPTCSTACLPSTSGSSSGDGLPDGIAGAADLIVSLPLGWTKKDSRGRLVSCPDVDVQAALILMMISRDELGSSEQQDDDEDEDDDNEDEDDEDASLVTRDESGGGADVYENGVEDETSSFTHEDHQHCHNRVFEFDLNKPAQDEE